MIEQEKHTGWPEVWQSERSRETWAYTCEIDETWDLRVVANEFLPLIYVD